MKSKEENAGDEEMPYQCNFVLIPRREKTEKPTEYSLLKSGTNYLSIENKCLR